MHNRRFRQFKIILRNPFRLPIGNITPATSPRPHIEGGDMARTIRLPFSKTLRVKRSCASYC
jgi:hypothetical protein